MNRICLAALAVASVFVFTNSASAQYYGGSCPSVRTYSSYSTYSSPYAYRSYGPGTHISRYAAPPVYSARTIHTVPRTTQYRYPTHSQRLYHPHHHHSRYYSRPYYGHGYGNGVTLRLGF